VCYQQTSLFNGFYFVAPSSFCLRLVPPTKARTHVSQPADNDRHAIHRLDTLSTPGRHPFFPPATPLKIRQRGAANSTPPRDAKTRSILGRHIPGQPWNGGSAYPASLDATTPCTNGGRPRTIQRDVSPSSIVVWAPSGTGLGSQVASPKRARDTAESSHQKKGKPRSAPYAGPAMRRFVRRCHARIRGRPCRASRPQVSGGDATHVLGRAGSFPGFAVPTGGSVKKGRFCMQPRL
jgi:hypothetical protein